MTSLGSNLLPWINVVALLLLVVPFFSQKIRNAYYRYKDPWPPARWLAAAYIYWVLSYLASEAPISNFFSFSFLRKDGALLFAYLPLFLVCGYRLSEKTVRRVIAGFIFLISFVAVLGLAQYITKSSVGMPAWLDIVRAESDSGLTFHGLYEAHNAAGVAYALGASICLCFLIYQKKSLRGIVLPLCLLMATLVGLFLTKSRTGYVAFLGGCVIPLVLNPKELRKRMKWLAFLVLPVILLIASQPQLLKRVEAITNTHDANVEMRFPAFEKAWQDFTVSPIIGIGFGRYNDDNLSFYGVPHLFYIATKGDVVNASSHAHDSYLQFLAEGGLIGFFLMMAVWVSLYRQAGRMAANLPVGGFGFALAKAVQVAVIVACMASFTEHSLGTGMAPLIVTTLAGLLRNFRQNESAVFLNPSTAVELPLSASTLGVPLH